MKCPFCNSIDTQVKNSRPAGNDTAVKRRRLCISCGAKFTTFERVEFKTLMVLKKSGTKTIIDRNKILKSMEIAASKRPITPDILSEAVELIIEKLKRSSDGIVTTSLIGKTVMEELIKIDLVACVRYASVYLDFEELEDFSNFIKNI